MWNVIFFCLYLFNEKLSTAGMEYIKYSKSYNFLYFSKNVERYLNDWKWVRGEEGLTDQYLRQTVFIHGVKNLT